MFVCPVLHCMSSAFASSPDILLFVGDRIVDNLPVATKVVSELNPSEPYYMRGFPVGQTLDNKHFLFNHIRLIISYNEDHNPGQLIASTSTSQ